MFDDNKERISFLDELKILREVVDELQKDTPHFQLKLILTGLKIIGESHVRMILQHLAEGSNAEDKRLAELVAGFDLVNEEDYTPAIAAFAEDILTSKEYIKI